MLPPIHRHHRLKPNAYVLHSLISVINPRECNYMVSLQTCSS